MRATTVSQLLQVFRCHLDGVGDPQPGRIEVQPGPLHGRRPGYAEYEFEDLAPVGAE